MPIRRGYHLVSMKLLRLTSNLFRLREAPCCVRCDLDVSPSRQNFGSARPSFSLVEPSDQFRSGVQLKALLKFNRSRVDHYPVLCTRSQGSRTAVLVVLKAGHVPEICSYHYGDVTIAPEASALVGEPRIIEKFQYSNFSSVVED